MPTREQKTTTVADDSESVSAQATRERSGRDWKVVIAVVGVLLAFEFAVSTFESRLSKDLVHQAEIPSIMESVAGPSESGGDGDGILFLGNSLIREGIDLETFGSEYREGGIPGELAARYGKVHPDDTSIVEWRYLFSFFANREGIRGTTVVLGYAQNQLTDDSLVQPRRLGASYFAPENRASILNNDVTDFGNRCEVWLSSFSSLFASAQRIRTRVLAMVIPDYERVAQRLNRSAQASDAVSVQQNESVPAPTFARLDRVLSQAKSSGINLVVVSIPVGDAYSLDANLLDRLNEQGVVHIDGRGVDGISADDFPDGYHMNESAAKAFSAFLARSMRSNATRE